MKKNELKNMLDGKGISKELYNLDGVGRTEERFCLAFNNGKWEVYFSENVRWFISGLAFEEDNLRLIGRNAIIDWR
jgi:hypothetical protein